MDKKEEGYETARLGIKNNFKSHVCWHVLGLLFRNDKNYEEAQKCYKTAIRFDPYNNQILRDLAVLQLQTSHYDGHLETRKTILQVNPQVKSSWIALAMAHHLCEQYEDAIQTLDQYLDNVSEATGVLRTTILDNEMAEIHLYKAMVLEEAGKYQECLDYLKTLDFRTGDILKHRSVIARMHLKLGVFEEAKTAYEKLFALVPENLEYLKGIEASSKVNLDDEETITSFIDALRERYPRSNLVRSQYLDRLSGRSFEMAFKTYCLPLVKKGAPSTLNSIATAYESDDRAASIGSVLSSILSTFENMEDKKAQFWCLYFLAQHNDRLGNAAQALGHLDAAYKLDSNEPDLFLLYARVLKNSGRITDAVKCTEHARKMDLGDRFLNAKCVKYLLRAGELQRAQETMALFLKEGTLEKQMADLADIQCIWFDLEVGKCLMAKGDHAGAKVYFDRVTKLFDDFVDDQLDFHNYALRKFSLTYYIETLRYERVIYREPRFRDAALMYIECERKEAEAKPIEEAMASLNVSSDDNDRTAYLKERLVQFHTEHPAVKQLLDGSIIAKEEPSKSTTESLPAVVIEASPFLNTLLASQ